MTVSHDIIPRLFTRPAWLNDAAPCAGHTELFYADVGSTKQADKARAICSTCPHRVRCLEYAIDNSEQFGVWGGMSLNERRSLRARRRAMGWTVGAHRNVPRDVA